MFLLYNRDFTTPYLPTTNTYYIHGTWPARISLSLRNLTVPVQHCTPCTGTLGHVCGPRAHESLAWAPKDDGHGCTHRTCFLEKQARCWCWSGARNTLPTWYNSDNDEGTAKSTVHNPRQRAMGVGVARAGRRAIVTKGV